MADQFLLDRITRTEALIEALENAIDVFAQDADIQSYTFDTGQDSQTVTRSSLSNLHRQIDALLNRRANLRARCGLDNSQTFRAGPDW